jgi:hypothetical protein
MGLYAPLVYISTALHGPEVHLAYLKVLPVIKDSAISYQQDFNNQTQLIYQTTCAALNEKTIRKLTL